MSDVRNYSRKFIAEFIELYQTLPALWKIKSKEYSDRNQKQQSYDKMIEKLREIEPNADKDVVTKKINSLRSSYRKEKKKVADSQKSGAGTDQMYVPSLWYYDCLRFLDDQTIVREPISNFDDSFLQDDTNITSVSMEVDLELDSPSIPGSSASNITPVTNISSPIPSKRVRQQHRQKEYDTIIASVGQRLCETKTDDQHDIFGQNVANKLRGLPREQRIYVEKLINDAIYEAELGNLCRGCSINIPLTQNNIIMEPLSENNREFSYIRTSNRIS